MNFNSFEVLLNIIYSFNIQCFEFYSFYLDFRCEDKKGFPLEIKIDLNLDLFINKHGSVKCQTRNPMDRRSRTGIVKLHW